MKSSKFIFALIFISCSSPIEPPNVEDTYVGDFKGQVHSDLVYSVLKPDKTVWAWGPNFQGQLGNGTLTTSFNPVKVKNIQNVNCIDMLDGVCFAGDNNGDIYFWGDYITYSEPPNLDTIVVIPKKISHLESIVQLNIYDTFVHILKKDGTVWRIKHNPSSPTKYLTPTQLNDLQNVRYISESLVLKNDGTIDELPYFSTDPLEGGLISDLNEIIDMDNVYHRRTVILKKDGTVWAWGRNDFGELGNGSNKNISIPVQVENLSNIVDISANASFNLALKEDGTVWYWGLLDKEGNDFKYVDKPEQIKNLEDVVLIYAHIFNIIMKQDGSYWTFPTSENINPQKVKF